ncbi:MAG: tetratricopeptide repeat protein [Proteobacteria bacterium]|nr:tetratricopeptide repeat protein [Pseudomonadota bacterium]
MSLVNEYLRKTQDEAPAAEPERVIPPILTSTRKKSPVDYFRFIYILLAVCVAGVVVYLMQGYLRGTDLEKSPASTLSDTTAGTTRPDAKPDSSVRSEMKTMAAARRTERRDASIKVQVQQAVKPALEKPRVETAVAAASQPKPVQPLVVAKRVSSTPSASMVSAPQAAATEERTVAPQARTVEAGPVRSPEAATKMPVRAGGDTSVGRRTSSHTPRVEEENIQPTPAPGTDKVAVLSEPEPAGPKPSFSAERAAPLFAPAEISVSSKETAAQGNTTGRSAGRTVKSKTDGKDASDYYRLGVEAQRENNLGGAVQFYRKGLQVAPTDIRLMANLSAVLIKLGEYDQASEVMQRARKIRPRDTKILSNLGMMELKRNRPAQAKAWFKQALDVNPGDMTVLTNMAYVCEQENDLRAAEQYYQRMLRIDGENVDTALAYASVLERTSRIKEAVAMYEKSLQFKAVKADPQLKGQINKRVRLLAMYTR